MTQCITPDDEIPRLLDNVLIRRLEAFPGRLRQRWLLRYFITVLQAESRGWEMQKSRPDTSGRLSVTLDKCTSSNCGEAPGPFRFPQARPAAEH